MTKVIRRIIAVVLLIVTVLLIGYSCHTCNRLANYPDTLDGYKRYIFRAKGGTMVAFTEDKAWYGTGEEQVILLEIISYEEGVITMKRKDVTYRFVAIDETTIYDENTKILLTRRADGG